MNNISNNNIINTSQITNIEEPEKIELKQFDDLHYLTYRENNNFISKLP